MKVFFDTNVYIAEALVGGAAERMIEATVKARWRIFVSAYILEEVAKVLVVDMQFSHELASVLQRRVARRARVATATTSAKVPRDPKDSPILQAALSCGADYLITNDRHLLVLNPFEGLRIISMSEYYALLVDQGLLADA